VKLKNSERQAIGAGGLGVEGTCRLLFCSQGTLMSNVKSLSIYFIFSCSFPSSNPRDSPGGQLTSPVPGSPTREASSAVSLSVISLNVSYCTVLNVLFKMDSLAC